jgi:predicted phosphodiesterase
MKIAVISDIHANYPALLAVSDHIESWKPDLVIVAGDIVNRGPKPLECIEFVLHRVRELGWLVTRGNHEDYVISHESSKYLPGDYAFELHRFGFWTYEKIGYDVSQLQAFPFKCERSYENKGLFCVTHASMRGNQDGIYTFTSDQELDKMINPHPDVLCVGHTHRPLIRHLNNTLVVNAGSVGLPFDGNPLLSYAQISWQRSKWQAEIIRLPYDHSQAEMDYYQSGFLEEGGTMAKLVLEEHRSSYSAAVEAYLENPNTSYV